MKIPKTVLLKRYGIALSFGLASLVVPLTTSQSAANDVGADIQHAIMCAGLLISDPERHLEECGVGDYNPGPLAPGGPGVPILPKPPAPPPPAPPPPPPPPVGPQDGDECIFMADFKTSETSTEIGQNGIIENGVCVAVSAPAESEG